MIVVVHKRDVSGDYIEMNDDDMIYVSMENGSKKPLEIVSTLYDNATTIVYRGVVDGKKDVVVKMMKRNSGGLTREGDGVDEEAVE